MAWVLRGNLRGAAGVVQSIIPGTNIAVNNTDPAHPIVSSSGGSGVVETVVGTADQIDVNSTNPANPVLTLSAAVLSALALAASSLQPGDIDVSIQGHSSNLDAWSALTLSSDYTWAGHHDFHGDQTRFTGTFASWGAGPGFECGVAAPYTDLDTYAFFVGFDRTAVAYIPMAYEGLRYHFEVIHSHPNPGTLFDIGTNADDTQRFVSLGSGPAQFCGVFGATGYRPSTKPGIEFGYSTGFSGAFMQAYEWGATSHIPFNISASEILMRIGGSYTTAASFDSSSTADDTRMQLYDVTAGALVRVSRGAADSGGVGFRALRIPN